MRERKGLKSSLTKQCILVSLLVLLWTMLAANMVYADPDPVMVSWYVTDIDGTPIDGAALTIYWANSPNGPFTQMPADDGNIYIHDLIADLRQNPIETGYWNPDYPNGMALCHIHPEGGDEALSGLYFYVKITYDSVVEYWPTATSYKPGDPGWEPTVATGSPSGYAAAGPGIGTGPTTAYPTVPCPPHVIPEAPLGSIMAAFSMIIAFGFFFVLRRPKLRLIS